MRNEGHITSLQFSLLSHKTMRSFKVKTLSLVEGTEWVDEPSLEARYYSIGT